MAEFQVFFELKRNEVFNQNSTFINFTRPNILGIMINKNQQLVVPEKLRYFREPSPYLYPLNLNLGFDDYQLRSPAYFQQNLKKVEKYLMDNKGRQFLQSNSQWICTSRNVLKRIMSTPYGSKNNAWSIKAIKFGNVIYLVTTKEPQRKKTNNGTYHFKFQQYCFADSPDEEPTTDVPIDENEQTSCVFSNSVGKFNILYAAEIAGIESCREIKNFKRGGVLNKCKFVMTKLLYEQHRSDQSMWMKNHKLLSWWIQAYLGRVDNIFVGFKNSQGMVLAKGRKIETREIPKNQNWKPKVCKQFLLDFFKKLETKLSTVNCPYTVHEFKYDSALKVIKCRVFEGKTEHSFLSENFIQYMQIK